VYILAEARLSELPGAVPSAKKQKKKLASEADEGFEVRLSRF
jgi:hypothetical protein